MKKNRLFVWLALLICGVLAMGLIACSKNADTDFVAPTDNYIWKNASSSDKLDSGVTIDGKYDEAFWKKENGKKWLTLKKNDAGHTATIYVTTHFGDNGLYLAFDVEEDTRVTFNPLRLPAYNSGIEFYFAFGSAQTAADGLWEIDVNVGKQFNIKKYTQNNLGNWTYMNYGFQKDSAPIVGATHEGNIAEGTCNAYSIEAFIPYTMFGKDTVKPDSVYINPAHIVQSNPNAKGTARPDGDPYIFGLHQLSFAAWGKPQAYSFDTNGAVVDNLTLPTNLSGGSITEEHGYDYVVKDAFATLNIVPEKGYKLASFNMNETGRLGAIVWDEETGAGTYQFVHDGGDVTVDALFVEDKAAYTDVAFTLKMRKDSSETLLTQGTSVKLKNTATGTESAPATVGENGTVTFHEVLCANYQLIADGCLPSEVFVLTEQSGSVSLTLEYPFATFGGNAEGSRVDYSKINTSSHEFTITGSNKLNGQETTKAYTEAKMTLPDELREAQYVMMDITIKHIQVANEGGYPRFGFIMTDGAGTDVNGNTGKGGVAYYINFENFHCGALGKVQDDIFDLWSGDRYNSHITVANNALTGDGLKLRIYRSKDEIRVYAYLNGTWEEFGTQLTNVTGKTDIRFYASIGIWKFSDYNVSTFEEELIEPIVTFGADANGKTVKLVKSDKDVENTERTVTDGKVTFPESAVGTYEIYVKASDTDMWIKSNVLTLIPDTAEYEVTLANANTFANGAWELSHKGETSTEESVDKLHLNKVFGDGWFVTKISGLSGYSTDTWDTVQVGFTIQYESGENRTVRIVRKQNPTGTDWSGWFLQADGTPESGYVGDLRPVDAKLRDGLYFAVHRTKADGKIVAYVGDSLSSLEKRFEYVDDGNFANKDIAQIGLYLQTPTDCKHCDVTFSDIAFYTASDLPQSLTVTGAENVQNGTVTVVGNKGGKVEITFTPATNYYLSALTVNGVNRLDEVGVDGKLVVADMYMADSLAIVATFTQVPPITPTVTFGAEANGLQVKLVKESDVANSTQTVTNGKVTFPELAIGSYEIWVKAFNVWTKSAILKLEPGKTDYNIVIDNAKTFVQNEWAAVGTHGSEKTFAVNAEFDDGWFITKIDLQSHATGTDKFGAGFRITFENNSSCILSVRRKEEANIFNGWFIQHVGDGWENYKIGELNETETLWANGQYLALHRTTDGKIAVYMGSSLDNLRLWLEITDSAEKIKTIELWTQDTVNCKFTDTIFYTAQQFTESMQGNLTVSGNTNVENGTVNVVGNKGGKVEITFTPATNYYLSALTVNGVNRLDEVGVDGKLVVADMYMADSLAIVATFTQVPPITPTVTFGTEANGLQVKLVKGTDVNGSMQTVANGKVTFPELAIGSYEIWVKAFNVWTKAETLTLQSGQAEYTVQIANAAAFVKNEWKVENSNNDKLLIDAPFDDGWFVTKISKPVGYSTSGNGQHWSTVQFGFVINYATDKTERKIFVNRNANPNADASENDKQWDYWRVEALGAPGTANLCKDSEFNTFYGEEQYLVVHRTKTDGKIVVYMGSSLSSLRQYLEYTDDQGKFVNVDIAQIGLYLQTPTDCNPCSVTFSEVGFYTEAEYNALNKN